MSTKHPIIVITGSSGSGSWRVSDVFNHIAWREEISHLIVDGSAFHRYERDEMATQVEAASAEGRYLSHFSPEGNRLDLLESLFQEFSAGGTGQYRHYLHTEEQAQEHGQQVGTFTPWQALPENLDLLVYQGLHGAFSSPELDVQRHVDLSLGVAPIVNLEWIKKIHVDIRNRGYTLDEVRSVIQHRLHDYVHYITPQFSRTDINFQRIPLVDTSNPFDARDIPENDESMVVISFREPRNHDFAYLLNRIDGAFMSRRNSLVVPGGKMEFAMEILLNPLVHEMMERRRQLQEI
ncbi:phosphoribulokinase [Sedimenticola thiotaurini]|uniref:phosphoribulokinase n=1 Tax=Sedimenticola thiotaurini TaxID=1543721 RepID=A0A0F7JXT9_9GAMM|nr:phosphoribulokinase [Sedimenticola thiotaurini]AKH19590.1 phosphoribulokinase [Sedimenticola thiotaurini]